MDTMCQSLETDRTPSICGRSPGALTSDSVTRLRTWVMARTVAATNHGRPNTEQILTMVHSTIRSRWYPCPFYITTGALIQP